MTKTFLLIFDIIILAASFNQIQLQRKIQSQIPLQSIHNNPLLIMNQNPLTNVTMGNYRNFQYYAKIGIGGPFPQYFDLLFDTGSDVTWVPALLCLCPISFKRYIQWKSQYFESKNQAMTIQYGRGYVKGIIFEDLITFQNISDIGQLLLIQQAQDIGGMTADGLLGLSNNQERKNILDIAYESNQLISNMYGFSLGRQQKGEKSYFYYNISKKQINAIRMIDVTQSNRWNIPIYQIYIGSLRVEEPPQQALIDTGTSLITLPIAFYDKLDEMVFSRKCMPKKEYGLRNCECERQQYPNITVVTDGTSFMISPQMYILGNGSDCFLGFQKINFTFIILGDIFLQNNTVFFDKNNNQIGFLLNSTPLIDYIGQKWVIISFNLIEILLIVIGCSLIYFRKKLNQNESTLNVDITKIQNNIEMH